MKINKIGINYTHGRNFSIERPFGSGDYLFLHMKTSARIILDGEELQARKNSVIIYSKGTPQYYYANDYSYANDFIHFDADGDRDLRNLPLNTPMVLPSTKQISKLLKDIYLEYISNNENRQESIELLMKLLFIKINELVAYKPVGSVLYGYYDALLDLRSEMYRHPEEKWTVDKLSKQVNLSPSHFQRLYKKTFGVTCISDVIHCKIEYAKVSLVATASSVKEISELCGYENEEHFMRQFKKAVGHTPTQYRKLYRK